METVRIVSSILLENGTVKALLETKRIDVFHRIIEWLHSEGFIDDSALRDILLDLAELSNLTGSDYAKKIKIIEEKISRALTHEPPSRNLFEQILRGEFSKIHAIIEQLYSKGRINDSVLRELMLDLAELSYLTGKDYIKKLKSLLRNLKACYHDV